MKIYKYLLESIHDINLLALVPLLIFFIFFTAMTIYVCKSSKSHNDKMSGLPLADS